jgi:hypothetical protein
MDLLVKVKEIIRIRKHDTGVCLRIPQELTRFHTKHIDNITPVNGNVLAVE